MRVYIVTVGDEILIGQIVDSNSAWIAGRLNLIGAHVEKILSVSDRKASIQHALDEGFKHADVILMTGGLGPTKDDITKKSIAEYFGVEMIFDEPTYERILQLFKRWGRQPTEAHREQCFMPTNARLLHNKMGTAPGMWFEKDGKILVSMPGVPYEMKYLMEHEVLPRMQKQFPGAPIVHRTILTVGEGESRIAKRIQHFEAALPSTIKLAYLPNLGKVRLRLTGTGLPLHELEQLLDVKSKELVAVIPDLVYGYDTEELAEVIGRLLLERNQTIATAESCTGGYLSHLLTAIPGSSRYYTGSVIAYSNAVKQQLLGVKEQTLTRHGAVSEETVKEMVQGTLQLLQTDLAVAVSGIAGPGGGSPEKPVGTVWIAVGDRKRTETYLLRAGKDRLKNIEYASNYALDRIRRFILQLAEINPE